MQSEKKTISSKYSGVSGATIKKNFFADTQTTQKNSRFTDKTIGFTEKTQIKSGKYKFQDKEDISNFEESPNKTRKKVDKAKE